MGEGFGGDPESFVAAVEVMSCNGPCLLQYPVQFIIFFLRTVNSQCC